MSAITIDPIVMVGITNMILCSPIWNNGVKHDVSDDRNVNRGYSHSQNVKHIHTDNLYMANRISLRTKKGSQLLEGAPL
jgi:hypothetical protein